MKTFTVIACELLQALFLLIHRIFAGLGLGIASYRPPSRRPSFNRVCRSLRQFHSLTVPLEAMQLRALVIATAKLGGFMAEVGVYQGSSAAIALDADGGRRFMYLFDTFAGLPESSGADLVHHGFAFSAGQYACSEARVNNNLSKYHCRFKTMAGLFPASTESGHWHNNFSFVHLDVDLRKSTFDALTWFYPRMIPGGIIVTHDYATCDGVREAFDEFFADKPEGVMELAGTQAMVWKL